MDENYEARFNDLVKNIDFSDAQLNSEMTDNNIDDQVTPFSLEQAINDIELEDEPYVPTESGKIQLGWRGIAVCSLATTSAVIAFSGLLGATIPLFLGVIAVLFAVCATFIGISGLKK